MLKYLKYELMGTYRFMISAILAMVVTLSSGRLLVNYVMNQYGDGNLIQSPIIGLAFAVMGFVLIGAIISIFFYIISSFRKELYEDRGYLTFSLPLSGSQILGAKLLSALIWITLLGVVSLTTFLVVALIGSDIVPSEIFEMLKYMFKDNGIGLTLLLIITGIVSTITLLLQIYFSITLSRVSIKNRKIGGFWIIVFLILNSITTYATVLATKIIPYYLDLNSFKLIRNVEGFSGNNTSIFMSPGGMMTSEILGTTANIGAGLFSLILIICLFLGTSYLLEKKLDI